MSFERLLSGPGLSLIYRALAERAGKPADNLAAPEITQRALAGGGDHVAFVKGGADALGQAQALAHLLQRDALGGGAQVALGGDGQVTLGHIVIKSSARKVRKLYRDQVLAGFAAPPNGIYAVFPQRKHLPLRVRLWIDYLKQHYGQTEFWQRTGL